MPTFLESGQDRGQVGKLQSILAQIGAECGKNEIVLANITGDLAKLDGHVAKLAVVLGKNGLECGNFFPKLTKKNPKQVKTGGVLAISGGKEENSLPV